MMSNSILKTDINPSRSEQEGRIRLELGTNTFLRLIEERQLCAADFHCLDCESKRHVWRLYLTACVKCMQKEPAP